MTQLGAVSTLKPMVGMVCTTWQRLWLLKPPIYQCCSTANGLINLEPVQDGRLSRIVQTKDEDPHLTSWCANSPKRRDIFGRKVTREGSFTRSSGDFSFCFRWCPIRQVRFRGRLLVPEEGSENRWEQDAHVPRFAGYAAVSCRWRCWFFHGFKSQSQKSKEKHCFGHVWYNNTICNHLIFGVQRNNCLRTIYSKIRTLGLDP